MFIPVIVYAVMHDLILLYRLPILGRGVFYLMVYTACLPVCGMSEADTLVRGTPVLRVAGMSFLEGWTGHLIWCREVVIAS